MRCKKQTLLLFEVSSAGGSMQVNSLTLVNPADIHGFDARLPRVPLLTVPLTKYESSLDITVKASVRLNFRAF